MDIYFDENHDITLDGSDIRFTTEDEDVAQRLTIRLQFILGEWFLNTSIGIPYPQTIFEQGYQNPDALYYIFNSVIKNTEGVETIDELILTPNKNKRTLSISLIVNRDIEVEVEV